MIANLHEYFKERKTAGFEQATKIISVNKGAVIYDIDQPFTAIYEIERGAVKLGKLDPRREEYIYAVLTPGDIFGNTAFLPDTFTEFSKAVVPSTLYVYETEFFKEHLYHDPLLTEWFITRMVSRWHHMESLFASVRHLDPRERILNTYGNLDRKIVTSTDRVVNLNRNLTNKDLADLTATTRQLVAQTLKCQNQTHLIET